MTVSSAPPISADVSADVSIIIVNWNTCDLLRNCLRSIITQTTVAHEIIVIDNASRDGSADMVRTEFPDITLIANSKNSGFAAANNQGLRISRGRTILLLNPDTLILDGAVDRMLGWLDRHPRVGCVGCQVLESPGVLQRTCFSDPNLLDTIIVEFGLMRLAPWIPFFGRSWYTDWDRQSEREVDVVSGMFMLVPRAVMDQVGLLDEAFFVYGEESDWCRRIRKAGYPCVFTPEAQIIHLDGGSKSTSQIRSRMHVQMQKSHRIYTKKHSNALGYAATRLLSLVTSVLRLGAFSALRLVRADENAKARVRLAQASLVYQFIGKEPVS